MSESGTSKSKRRASQKRSPAEQHLAVFGESGSGKTVLLSSFYGHMTEPATEAATTYRITANDQSQHTSLYQNYLGMRDADRAPSATRPQLTTYAFTVTIDQPPHRTRHVSRSRRNSR